MRRTGTTWRIERSTGRSPAGRQIPCSCAQLSGMAHPGSWEFSPRPGYFFLVPPHMTVCAFPDCLAKRPLCVSVFAPLERKPRLGVTGRQFHERGDVI